jgi:replication fork clamp-binding protein CrfC
MTEINFTSTYRIPITQAGINSAKKTKLKELIQSYPNGLIGNNKVGNARVSMPDAEDEKFISKLRKIGYKVYQKIEGENISKENLDAFIKNNLDTKNFKQKGKNPTRLSKDEKDTRRFKRRIDGLKKAKQSPETTEQPALTAEQPKAIAKPIVKRVVKLDAEEIARREDVRKCSDYIRIMNENGKDFAEAVFFGRG